MVNSILLAIYLEMELLNHRLCHIQILQIFLSSFPKYLHKFTLLSATCESFSFSIFISIFPSFFHFGHFGG